MLVSVFLRRGGVPQTLVSIDVIEEDTKEVQDLLSLANELGFSGDVAFDGQQSFGFGWEN